MGYCPSQDWDRYCRDTDVPEDGEETDAAPEPDIVPEPWDDPGFELPPRECVVILTCTAERVPESSVKFLDISEDIAGWDLLTFECPKCGKTHESYVLG